MSGWDVVAGQRPLTFIGGFESTYQPAFDVDNTETTAHDTRWQGDFALLLDAGVRTTRYPIRWHRAEREPGRFDWRATDERLGWLEERGVAVIADLLHHTSYPRWLAGGFTDPGFAPAFLRFVEAFAARYPHVAAYTLCNEPFTTCMLSGHEGIWPPHLTGTRGFVELARALLVPVAEASRRLRELLPQARHVWVDACERHVGTTPGGQRYAQYANDRRFFALDAFLGLPSLHEGERPFVRDVARSGGEDLLAMEPGLVDVVGLDYYAHCQWEFTGANGEGHMHAGAPDPLASLLLEYAERYGRPVILGETNVRGYASDRASWLKYTVEQCEAARDAGVAVEGYCWFPFVDSCDWDSVLTECNANIDPVGVYWLDDELDRRPSCMSEAFAAAASGAPATDLPAYRFREPVATWLKGWLPHMSHWDWQEPLVYPTDPPPPPGPVEMRIEDALE